VSYGVGYQQGSFMSFIDTWGERLLMATFIYSIISLAMFIGLYSSGYSPPQVVPPIVAKVYSKAINLWSDISGKVYSGKSAEVLLGIFNSIQSILMLLFGLVVNSAVTFIWLGVLAVELIPPPFTLYKILLAALAGFAQTILVLYLIKGVMTTISSYLPFLR
jgi:hypothetical protein